MIESPVGRLELMENAADYADAIRARRNRLLLFTVATTLFAALVIAAVRLLAPNAIDAAPVLALACAGAVALPVVLWNEPRRGYYAVTFGACIAVVTPANLFRDPFAKIPFWWNVSTAAEVFTGSHALGFIHISLAEIIMIFTAAFWLMRRVANRDLKIHRGVIFGNLAVYSLFCLWAFLNGMINHHGLLEFALQEVRAQAYFCFAYILACNLIDNRKQAMQLLWVMMAGVGVRCVLGTIIYLQNTAVTADEGVLSHEDSLLVNIVMLGALVFSLAKVEAKLKWFMIALTPFAICTSLANGRRAGIACFLVAFPVVMLMSAVLLRERRRQISIFLGVFAVLAAIYLPIAWNGQGAWALPARAIRSQSDPNGRDASSDAYRFNENQNLRVTRDSAPILGWGYGHEYLHPFAQPGRYDVYMYLLPHNGILWIWMRLGHLGFLAFWLFVVAVLTRGPNMLKTIRDPRLQVFGILAVATFLMLIIYGQYDLSFTNYRTMWLTGTLLGLMANLPRLVDLKRAERAVAGLSNAGQGIGDDLDVRDVDESASPLPANRPAPNAADALFGVADDDNEEPENADLERRSGKGWKRTAHTDW